ncbi:hypothetical protein [uncultured Enterovirga sp.]|uniref:hypothetical protein n=1 Tax=uncultured Enterovirga sp. TaxID=2026352 RepID=UPI0035C9BEDB
MTASAEDIVAGCLTEMDRLIDEARRKGFDPDKVAGRLRIQTEAIAATGAIADEGSLRDAIATFESAPGLAGLGLLGNALGRYRASLGPFLAARPVPVRDEAALDGLATEGPHNPEH